MMEKNNASSILALVHIEKAAGTTLIHILRRNYLFKYCDVRPLSNCTDGFFQARDLLKMLTINPNLKVIAGHSIVPYSDIQSEFTNLRFISLMRNPIDRYISQYRHISERKGKNISFEDFLNTESVSNFQAKKIAGMADLKRAIDVINNRFLLVGISEEFDEFLLFMKHELSDIDFDPQYEEKNVAGKKVKSDFLRDKYLDQIIENNSVDLALYDYIKSSVIPRQIDRYGDTFYSDLKEFRSRKFKRVHTVLSEYSDYAYRKCYVEPITSIVRRINGLPRKGSYGLFPYPDNQPW